MWCVISADEARAPRNVRQMHTQVRAPKVPRETWSVNASLTAPGRILDEDALRSLCRRAALEFPEKHVLDELAPLMQLMESVRADATAARQSLAVEQAETHEGIADSNDGTSRLTRDVLLQKAPGRTRAGFFVAS